MNPMSSENQNLQKEWCDSASEAIQKGACEAVNETAAILKQNKIEIGPVVEIGPQWGFGLEAWELHTASALGVEIVPEFHEACISKGLKCLLGAAEDLDTNEELAGKYNWYLRDSAEHFVDRKKAFENIMDRLLNWIFISVPIEPWEPKDKAHFSKFSSVREAQSMFKGMIPVSETIREPSGETIGRYRAIWKKPTKST